MGATHNAAPKGRNKIARGNAPGYGYNPFLLALKGRNKFYAAPSGREIIFASYYPGRCPGLFYFALSGQ